MNFKLGFFKNLNLLPLFLELLSFFLKKIEKLSKERIKKKKIKKNKSKEELEQLIFLG